MIFLSFDVVKILLAIIQSLSPLSTIEETHMHKKGSAESAPF